MMLCPVTHQMLRGGPRQVPDEEPNRPVRHDRDPRRQRRGPAGAAGTARRAHAAAHAEVEPGDERKQNKTEQNRTMPMPMQTDAHAEVEPGEETKRNKTKRDKSSMFFFIRGWSRNRTKPPSEPCAGWVPPPPPPAYVALSSLLDVWFHVFPLLPFRLLFRVLSVPRPFFLCQVADDDRSLLPALECLASIVIAVGGALDVSVLSQPGVLSQPVAVQADFT